MKIYENDFGEIPVEARGVLIYSDTVFLNGSPYSSCWVLK